MQVLKINILTGQESSSSFSDQEIAEILSTETERLASLPPDWETLYGRFLAGDLKPIFDDVCEAAENSTAIALRYFNLVESFKIRTEQALKDCLDKLIQAGYVVSEDHKSLWNNATSELNFSELVRLS